MGLQLPKTHLSFSQIDLWLHSRETYRKKYYGDVRFATTPAMSFGNAVTQAMERGEEWVSFIPHHDTFERVLCVDIDGIPIRAAVDNINTATNTFREQKTGKTPWTQRRVDKHLQLDIYSLLLETEDGFVDDQCDLIWVKTADCKKEVDFNGITLTGTSIEPCLTGEYVIFPRTITKDDRARCKTLIREIGNAISEDYAAYKKFYQ